MAEGKTKVNGRYSSKAPGYAEAAAKWRAAHPKHGAAVASGVRLKKGQEGPKRAKTVQVKKVKSAGKAVPPKAAPVTTKLNLPVGKGRRGRVFSSYL
jgi:hypothetical protein